MGRVEQLVLWREEMLFRKSFSSWKNEVTNPLKFFEDKCETWQGWNSKLRTVEKGAFAEKDQGVGWDWDKLKMSARRKPTTYWAAAERAWVEVVFPTLIGRSFTNRVLSPILMHLVQERLANWCKSRGEHLKWVEDWSMHPTRRSQVFLAWKGEN